MRSILAVVTGRLRDGTPRPAPPPSTTPRPLAAPASAPVGALLGALLFLAGACGGETEIDLRVDRSSISAGGIEFATITAAAYLAGDRVGSGTQIDFETTAGSFADNTSTTTVSKSTDGSGVATVKLYSGPSAGSATVTATFYDETTGLSATSSLTVSFTTPTGTSSPVDGTFRLTCDAVNIGALREPMPDIKVTCKLTAQTSKGVSIPASALKPLFLTEAGSFTPKKDDYTGEQVFIYSPKGGGSTPRDLPPEQALNEPSHTDKNGKVRNPRDGLATLVAVVDGEEAFTDVNGNGKYDQGEPFTDAAEPFVDVDDDDTWDPDEKYLDVNQNGQWDRANAVWDGKTKIMALHKILWTGRLDNGPATSRIDRLSTSIPSGGKLTLKAYVLDANMNPVAAFQKNQDYLEWSLTSGGDAASNDNTTPALDNELGFSFDKAASTERKRWRLLANSFTPKSFEFTVEDGYPTDTDPATNFSVTATVYSTPGPGADGYFLNQLTEPIADKVDGTCD
jgi:hypothetical protein